MKQDSYEVHLQFPIQFPMKDNDKKSFIEYMIKGFVDNCSANLLIIDSYYVDRRSEGGGHTFELIIQVAANISSIIGTYFAISQKFKKLNSNPQVFVKRKDGLYAEITDGMSEEDVIKALSRSREEPNYSIGQIIDISLPDEVDLSDSMHRVNISQIDNTQVFVFGPILFTSNSCLSIEAIIKINDHSIINLLESGSIGLSPDMLVRKFSCSVCNQDYELCEHEVDKIYNKIKCKPLLAEWNGRNVSIVSKPLDPRAKMTDMLIIRKNAIKKEYSWRSLQADEKNNRFRRIKRAMLKGLIDKHTASHFNEFFNLNWEGISTYQHAL